MTRWRIIWAGIVLALAGLDAWREADDIQHGRTHTTGTTFSASNRWVLEQIPGGRWVFAAGLGLLFGWYFDHITDHLDTQQARW